MKEGKIALSDEDRSDSALNSFMNKMKKWILIKELNFVDIIFNYC